MATASAADDDVMTPDIDFLVAPQNYYYYYFETGINKV
jgi:hypothetical protein